MVVAVVKPMLLALLLLAAPAVAAPQLVAAKGQWAVFRDGRTCEAAVRSLGVAARNRPPARASLSFDMAGPRRGQFAARLSRVPRPGASVMLHVGPTPFLLVTKGDMAWSRGSAQEAAIVAALRREGGMRVEARAPGGRRIVDRFSLEGAPLAIDAAAACAASRPPRP